MSKPRLLDLFSGAGGCARGYQMAGFHVTGVDIKPQPRYAGDVFIQGDALEFCREHGHEFDAIHASPPCQAYSSMRHLWDREHPDLVAETRDALNATGNPWVIENVPGAPMVNGVTLCGAMFGLKVYRHRRFESNVLLMQPPHPRHRETIGSHGRGRRKVNENGWATVTGGIGDVKAARIAMGIEWMSAAELTQAIPPAYTEFIGKQLLTVLSREESAA